jgi:hypothetical protein
MICLDPGVGGEDVSGLYLAADQGVNAAGPGVVEELEVLEYQPVLELQADPLLALAFHGGSVAERRA